jgi:hypothetical protein
VDYEWWVCEVTSDCDPGLECRDGFCSAPCGVQGAACGESVACCGELTCVEGICAAVECAGEGEACAATGECCGDLVCTGGACQVVDDSGEPPDDDSPDEVTQLPDTGVGTGGNGRSSLAGLASLAAGAAALLAGKTLRKGRDEVSQTGDETS